MLKNLSKIGLLLVLLLSMTTTAFASSNSESNTNTERFIIQDDRVVDTETGKSYGYPFRHNENGEQVEVSLGKLKSLLESQYNSDDIESNKMNNLTDKEYLKGEDQVVPQNTLIYFYLEDYNILHIGSPFDVSAWVNCPSGSNPCTITSTTGWSTTESFSANVDGGYATIRASAGFSWSTSAIRTTSYSIPIDPGKSGRMMFFPEYDRTYGTLQTWLNGYKLSDKYIHADSPRKVTGTNEPAGTYYIEFR